jgi:hypothetical protein
MRSCNRRLTPRLKLSKPVRFYRMGPLFDGEQPIRANIARHLQCLINAVTGNVVSLVRLRDLSGTQRDASNFRHRHAVPTRVIESTVS